VSTQGKGFFKNEAIAFTLPEGWELLAMAEPNAVPGAEDVASTVKEAINNPVAMEKLNTLFPLENPKVAIIVDDQTRPTPAYQVLMPLIEVLADLGVKDDDIDIVMGRGTHKVADEPTIRKKIGDQAYERFRFTMHDPDDESKLTHMGTTSRGNKVYINSVVADAGLVIAIGLSNPHYFAGYGGGPKIILPGVSSRKTIAYNHHMISDPNTVPDVLEGNPIWEDMLEAARIAKLAMKIDVVLNQDQEIYKVFAGEVEATQAAAVEALKEVYGVPVPRMSDVTIASGYPLETNMIQSGKALLNADMITKKGGVVVLISACSEGPGPMYYETLAERPAPETVIEWIGIGKASPTGGPMAARVRELLKSKKLIIVTDGVLPEQLADMEMIHAPTVEDALEIALADHPNAEVTILPVGGSTLPILPK
jgi:nickel-dependent lactate racemase